MHLARLVSKVSVQYFGSETGVAVTAEQGKASLELNHGTHATRYLIDQCHFAYTMESLVPYVLKTMRFFDSNKYRLNQLPIATCEKKFVRGHYRPRLISFNDTAIVRKFYLDVYQRSFLKICCQLEENLHMITFDHKAALDPYSSLSF